MGEPPATDELVWRELAAKAVGNAFERLESQTSEGLLIAPLYGRPMQADPQPWRAHHRWSIAQRVDHPDPEAANALALQDLEGGADALVLVDEASSYARGFGGDLASGDLNRLFAGVELDFIKLRLDAGRSTLQALAALADLATARRLTSATLDIDIGFDPIGWGERLGMSVPPHGQPFLEHRARGGFGGTLYLADGRPWHEAGAGEAEELAAVLATALAYLRSQEALGIPLEDARDAIAMLLAADADLFMGLAKFRAMRRLWSRVCSACGLPPKTTRLHAETSWRMMSRIDPWINAMRATAAAFAAGLGGADVISVLPFTLANGLPDEPARRLGRNVHHILMDEAHLAKVQDPSAGSGAVESLTNALCERAWTMFQEVERHGGAANAASRDMLRTRIRKTAETRANAIATLRLPLIGTSRFPTDHERRHAVLDEAPVPTRVHELALQATRDAAPFERIRERMQRFEPPGQVFLATTGAHPTAGRDTIEATSFFAAGGIATTAQQALPVENFADSGARLACLCGAQDPAAVDRACEFLRAAGACAVYVIGASSRPTQADGHVFEGCQALAILEHAVERIEQS